MKTTRKVMIALCIAIAVGCVGYIIYYFVSQQSKGEIYEEVQTKAVKPEGSMQVDSSTQTEELKEEIPIDFDSLQQINPDIYAWIQIEGTNINYPIVQSATDDAYYLEHTIEGVAGLPGSIYTENVNSKEFTDFNTLIYGHDMLDGSMFADLHKYADAAFMQEHSNMIVYTPEKKLIYEIAAAIVYDDRHIMKTYDFSQENQRQAYIDSSYGSRSMSNVTREDVPITVDSHIITMSTCISGHDDQRFLVLAVLKDA